MHNTIHINRMYYSNKTERVNMKNNKKKNLPGYISFILIVSFTTYVLLNTFVLADAYQTDIESASSTIFEEALANTQSSNSEASTSETTEDENTTTTDEADSEDIDDTTANSETENEDTDSESSSGHGSHSGHGMNSGKGGPGNGGSGSDKHRSSGSGNSTESSDSTESSNTTDSSDSDSESSSSTGDITVSVSDETYETYSDDNITITVTEYTVNNTQVYVADVTVSSAEYLKTAFANDTYGKNVTATTSETAAANNAILAINGDYYGAQETGYVIRNGVVYRDTTSSDEDILCIYADGTMEIVNTSEKTADELVAEGVWQAFSFGPALVEDGTVSVSVSEEVGKAMTSNPRTAIGIIDSNHYLFVVSDGRTDESEGLTLYELASFMESLGATTTYNLDGGGSSTMYYNGTVINNPTTTGNSIKEREVSDIVYIG